MVQATEASTPSTTRRLGIRLLHPTSHFPVRSTSGSFGLDLFAHLISDSGRPNKAIVPPRSAKLIPTGISIQLPHGYAGLILSRSGMALRSIFVANSPSLIDSDFTGEIQVILYNGGVESHYVQHEDRIAQLLLVPVGVLPLEALETGRGAKG